MRIARLMGWSPTDVLAFDDATLTAAVAEAREVGGWLPVPELLTMAVELLEALLITTVRLQSKRPPSGLKPTRLPRPGDAAKPKAKRMTWSEFAKAAEGGVMAWQ